MRPQSSVPLESSIRLEIESFLNSSAGRLAQVWEGYKAGEKSTVMARCGRAGNSAAAANLIVTIETLLGLTFPTSPARAAQSARSLRALNKTSGDPLSPVASQHVQTVISRLEAFVDDAAAVEEEAAGLEKRTLTLAEAVEQTGGVYVYSYQHYLRHPYAPSPSPTHPEWDRTLFKVGMTTRSPKNRVLAQMRGTAAPEEPVVLRVYRGTDPPAVMERKFHALLSSAGHERESAKNAGREWFLASLDYLDTIADILGCETLANETL